MPKLLVFAPCERVIVADNNTSTLISLLETVTVKMPSERERENDEADSPIGIAYRWQIYSLWHSEDGDAGKTFQVRLVQHDPTGALLADMTFEFEFSSNRNVRNVGSAEVFPVTLSGEYWLKLSLREKDTDNPWQEVSQYPVRVNLES
jgi:hypothetical protein